MPDLAAIVKAKYPEYQDVPDDELTKLVIAKYPEYADLAKPTEPAPVKTTEAEPGFFSRIGDQIGGVVDTAKTVGKIAFGIDSEANSVKLAQGLAKPFQDWYNEPGVITPTVKLGARLSGMDTDAISTDYNKGNYAALAGDILPSVALTGLTGAVKAGLFKNVLAGSSDLAKAAEVAKPIKEVKTLPVKLKSGTSNVKAAFTALDQDKAPIDLTTGTPDLAVTDRYPKPSSPIQLGPDKVKPDFQSVADHLETKPDITIVGGKKFADSEPIFNDLTQKWISDRAAAAPQGDKIAAQFKASLGDIKPEDLPKFQTELANGEHPDVSKFYDDWYSTLRENGINIEKKANYLPQWWEDKPEVVQEKLGKRLNTSASFTKESIYDDYQAGIKAGLTPKFTPSELPAVYEKQARKLIANKTYFDKMREKSYITAYSKSTPDSYAVLDPNVLPGGFDKSTTWTAAPQVKSIIENYLSTPDNVMSAVADKAGKLGGMALSTGLVPTTAIGPHGLNIMRRAYMEGGTPRVASVFKTLVNPKAAVRNSLVDADTVIRGVKNGLVLHPEDSLNMAKPFIDNPTKAIFADESNGMRAGINSVVKPIATGINAGYNLSFKAFTKPLFSAINTIKKEAYAGIESNLVKKGMSLDEAGKGAADAVNNFYSGTNYDLLYRNKNYQNTIKSLFLAPDWLESNAKLGMKTIGSVGKTDPISMIYQKAALRQAAMYTTANIINHASTGKWMFQNPSGREFDVAVGTTSDGKTRYIDPFGTASDFMRAPLTAITGGIKDKSAREAVKLITSKASVPASAGLEIYNGQDIQGDPNLFKSKDNFGNPIPVKTRTINTAAQGANLITPRIIHSGINLISGEQSLEEALANASGMPTRYSSQKKVKPMFNFKIKY